MKLKNIPFSKIKKFLGTDTFVLLIASVVLGLIEFVVEASFIFVLQGLLIAFEITDQAKSNLPDWYPTSVSASLFVFIVFGILRSVNTIFRVYTTNFSNQQFVQHCRAQMYLYGLSNRSDVNSVRLISLFTDTSARGGWAIYFAAQIIIKTVSAASLFIVGLLYAPIEMFVGLGLLILFIFPFKLLNKKVTQTGNGLVEEWEKINTAFSQGLRNNFFLRAHGLLNTLLLSGRESIRRYTKHHKNNFLISAAKVGAPNLFGTVIISVIIYISLNYVHTSGAVLLSFLYVFIRFIQSAGEVAIATNDFKVNLPGLKLLWNFFNMVEESQVKYPKTEAIASSEKRVIESIEVDIKKFGYNGAAILEGVSLALKKGDKLHVHGKSGSGKSTLISLLLGLYKVQFGKINVNGREIEFDQTFYNSISYIGPEPFLLATSIRENVLFGNPNKSKITDKDIVEILDLCCIWEELRAKNLSLDSYLQENAELSTGQKQRIALARALIRKPELIILDEATANIDPETEKRIFSKINNTIAKSIFIFVSHKNVEYQRFDKVLGL